nr:hypothetical protein [Bacillus cereus]
MDLSNYWIKNDPLFGNLMEESTQIVELKNGGNLQEELYSYSQHFKIAANELITKSFAKIHSNEQDYLFFPITYLYRQSLELILKALAFSLYSKKQVREFYILNVKHNLSESF